MTLIWSMRGLVPVMALAQARQVHWEDSLHELPCFARASAVHVRDALLRPL